MTRPCPCCADDRARPFPTRDVCAFHTLSRALLAHLLRGVGADDLADARETGGVDLGTLESAVMDRRAEIGAEVFDGEMVARFEGWFPSRFVDDGRAKTFERMVVLARALMTLAMLDVRLLEPVDTTGPFPTLDTVDGDNGPFVSLEQYGDV